MFTGLIETVGEVIEVVPASGARRIGIVSALSLEGAEPGASVAVDGVCLTVTARKAERFFAEVVEETLGRTTLGRLEPGSRVNLERSLRVGDRLGGHVVQGHVDGTAPLLEVLKRGADYRLRVGLTGETRRFVAWKGAVTLHGVSLTVASLDDTSFGVALVPETLRRTTLGDFRVGSLVNVEVDLLARYLDTLQASRQRSAPDE